MLNDLLATESVRGSASLEQFLSEPDPELFKWMTKEWEKKKGPSRVEEVENQRGVAAISVDEHVWEHNQQHSRWVEQQQLIL